MNDIINNDRKVNSQGKEYERGKKYNENSRNLDEIRRVLDDYLIEYLQERIGSRMENEKKNEFFNQFDSLSLHEKKIYKDFIILMVNHNSNINSSDDDFLQLQYLLSSMNRLDQMEVYAGVRNHYKGGYEQQYGNEYLPQTIDLQVLGGKYYHDERIFSDFKADLKKVKDIGGNMRNGIQQGETINLNLLFGNRSKKIQVHYDAQSGYLYFSNGNEEKSVFIDRKINNRPISVVFGQKVPEGEEGTYMELVIKLNWR